MHLILLIRKCSSHFVGKLDRDFPEYVSREVNFKITTPDMLYNPKSHVEQIVHVIKAIDDVKWRVYCRS